jgi:hypothetical protein
MTVDFIIDFESQGLYGKFLCFSFGMLPLGSETYVTSSLEETKAFFLENIGATIWAYNVEYEYEYARKVLGINVYNYTWKCVRVLCHTINHNFSGNQSSLDFVSSVLTPNNKKQEFKPDNWDTVEVTQELLEYNKQDVITTRAVYHECLKRIGKFTSKNTPPSKRDVWIKEQHKRAKESFDRQMTFLLKTLIPARTQGLCFSFALVKQMRESITAIREKHEIHEYLPKLEKGKVVENLYEKTGGVYRNKLNLIRHYDGFVSANFDPSLVYAHCPIEKQALTSKTRKAVTQRLLEKGLPKEYINESGNVDFGELATEEQLHKHPLILPLVTCSVIGTYDNYLKNYIKFANWLTTENFTVHSHLDICGTLTGRLSSSAPNIQNIGGSKQYALLPEVQEKVVAQFRKLIVPRPGNTFISGDIDRAELMILGKILSNFGDSAIKELINANEDIHSYNANLWGLTRLQAKRLVFSIMYGATAFKVAEICGCDHKEAEGIIKRIKARMPALAKAMEYYERQCELLGGVYDLFGDFKCYPFIHSPDFKIVQRVKRQLFNAVIQGTNASLMSWLCPQVSDMLFPYGGFIVAIVHDEILIEVPEQHKELHLKLNDTFNNRFDIPGLEALRFGLEFKQGNSWYETK